ncbi:MAG: tRNA (adenosine(37)-N6)-threonylcarbamoyltransferase complex transferase subunit TsaD [Alphaproteobacteria bacterium]|nr:tRNA (adenosine(37)-N6)-threonylcarbamoyltransferase complex transferase subunit TsaD [Alphaproteobacteria bacterium]
MIVLGLETSCDETAAAIVDSDRRIRADVVHLQLADHQPYGGVVPEIAARAHVEVLDSLIARAMTEAALPWSAIDGVAATAGPGLIAGLMVGLVTGKALAATLDRPLVAINHLEGHALSARLVADAPFPYLLLLISGGHCQLLIVEGVGRYRRLGTTIDDAVGEAFDKVAKLIGLGYPGGPAIERAAQTGRAARFKLPRPMKGRPGCDFSFSGLKTAVRHLVHDLAPSGTTVSAVDASDVAAAFQAVVADVLEDRTANAIEQFLVEQPPSPTLVVAGGVAANATLRARLESLANRHGLRMIVPPPRLCTDNAAMIAWAGVERLTLGQRDPLTAPARARWPLAGE